MSFFDRLFGLLCFKGNEITMPDYEHNTSIKFCAKSGCCSLNIWWVILNYVIFRVGWLDWSALHDLYFFLAVEAFTWEESSIKIWTLKVKLLWKYIDLKTWKKPLKFLPLKISSGRRWTQIKPYIHVISSISSTSLHRSDAYHVLSKEHMWPQNKTRFQ